MSVESPKVKPTACDPCRKLNIQCNLDNYIDDCERCTSLGEKCFVTDDYNITIHKVPQRTLHNFNSGGFVSALIALHIGLRDNQSNGENTYAIIDRLVSKFEGIPKEATKYQEINGFLNYHFMYLFSWFQENREHQVWTVARYDEKTRQSLKKLGAILKSIELRHYRHSVALFAWQIDTIEAEEPSPGEALSNDHNQTHAASSDPTNEPERMLSGETQAGESRVEESQHGELQDGKAPKDHSI
ncbi:uncharacterized protein EAE97_005200 [Botrytis byssoidea]|uniref:Zn(2)-C6 fungal-type domain-containing protein n=1 Tax=Botrytis byssoidea TaxID=139641 RepID=A0A9P5M6W9_9HELO|nr:uncharacterized protein EAE97_005200 [Botrytis byssoidea]KAF7944567.1 hypothetical protein EAE97_005200 [Botrytis byssoidea]